MKYIYPAYLSCYGGGGRAPGAMPSFHAPPQKRYYTHPFKPGIFVLLRGEGQGPGWGTAHISYPPKKRYYTHPLQPGTFGLLRGAGPRMGHCPHFIPPPPKKVLYTPL